MKAIPSLATGSREHALSLRDLHHGLEDRRRQLQSGCSQAFVEFGTDASRAEASGNSTGLAQTSFFEHENVLHGDQVSFHAHTLGNVRDAAAAVAEARHLDEHID